MTIVFMYSGYDTVVERNEIFTSIVINIDENRIEFGDLKTRSFWSLKIFKPIKGGTLVD